MGGILQKVWKEIGKTLPKAYLGQKLNNWILNTGIITLCVWLRYTNGLPLLKTPAFLNVPFA
jgi:hypothetical protein